MLNAINIKSGTRDSKEHLTSMCQDEKNYHVHTHIISMFIIMLSRTLKEGVTIDFMR